MNAKTGGANAKVHDRQELDRRVVEVKRRLDIGHVIGASVRLLGTATHKTGLCPFHNEKSGSFHVYIDGDDSHYHCFGCGAHGDVIGFVQQQRNLSFIDALKELESRVGTDFKPREAAAPRPVKNEKREEAEKKRAETLRETLTRIWRGLEKADGSPAEAYLRGRGLDVSVIGGVPPSIRFHPQLTHVQPLPDGREDKSVWPAMVQAVQAPSGEIIALHRTWLMADPEKGFVKAKRPEYGKDFKAKKILGPYMTGAIRFAMPGRDDYAEDTLLVGEGSETTLAFMIDCVREGRRIAAWAAGALGNICGSGDPTKRARRHPHFPDKYIQTEYPNMERPGVILPASVKQPIVLGDGDSDPLMTRALLNRAVRRWQAEGRLPRIVMAPPGLDFGDIAEMESAGGE
ncbi:MAG: hypothetical protein IPK59_10405 [Rhodospirillaceae bacterium]|nr:hypothetical protein [Rhodospirillaceae bacterium]